MDVMTELAKAVEGLLVTSESDYPLEPFTWTDPAPFSPEALVKLAKLPEDTPIDKETVNAFFKPMLHLDEGATDADRTRVKRFRALIRLLRRSFSDLAVYKLGTIEIPVYILGKLADGTVAGLHTTVVET